MKLIVENGNVFLSSTYLQSFGIGYHTIKHWSEREVTDRRILDNKVFIKYKDIPAPTRLKKLPAESLILKEYNKTQSFSKVKDLLHEAFYYKHASYKSFYEKETSFTAGQITRFAQLHSVFQAIIDLKKRESFRHLEILHSAFNDLFPAKYKTKQAFSQALLKATVEGVLSVAMDKRTFGNNDRSKDPTTPQVDYIISALVACNGKFTNPVMLKKANEYFKVNGISEYSLSWMKKQRREWLKNIQVYAARYGQKEANKMMPYASLKNAEHTHIQWQIDGVTLPFWEAKFHRSILVFVIDNASKKIIGYSIGNTENSNLIKGAISNAVCNTGVLPFEIVMDNHSFTQTQAAFNFEAFLNKYGSRLTKTSNPRQKIIVERYIQNLNSLFKEYSGYLGQSIRSKSIEAVASDEQKTQYAKNFKSKNDVLAITTLVIEDYNNKEQKGKAPNQLYIENPHLHPIQLNQFHKAELLPYSIEKIIRNGQINIMRGVLKYEYQLPAHLFQKWNNQTVIITHDALEDGIYLYNKYNGEGIVYLKQKGKINNAKALQTSEDITALNKNKGRLTGIKSQAIKQLENIRDEALNIDHEAYLSVNAMTTPKDVRKELEQNSNLKMLLESKGVIVNNLPTESESFNTPASLQPKKIDKNPFTAPNNKIELIDPTKVLDDE